jgi:hypothetical protein
VGSRGRAADDYVRHIVEILHGHETELGRPLTIVDIGCGDFEVGRAIVAALPTARYIGCDIVGSLINHHRERFATDNVFFELLDIVTQPPPQGDICLVRQVFQHLSNNDIKQALSNLHGFTAVYVTEGQPSTPSGPLNPDKVVGADVRFDWRTGSGRGVELSEHPFGLTTQEMFRTLAPPHEIIATARVIFHSGEHSES